MNDTIIKIKDTVLTKLNSLIPSKEAVADVKEETKPEQEEKPKNQVKFDPVKYQELCIEIILETHLNDLYKAVATSKETIKQIIYERRQGNIDADTYKENYYMNKSVILFFEKQIAERKALLMQKYVFAHSAPKTLLKSTHHANQTCGEYPFEFPVYIVLLANINRIPKEDRDEMPELETNIKQLKTDLSSHILTLKKDNVDFAKYCLELEDFSKRIADLCKKHLFIFDDKLSTPIITLNEINEIINEHVSLRQRDKYNYNKTLNDLFLERMMKFKEDDDIRLAEESEQKSKQKPKK